MSKEERDAKREDRKRQRKKGCLITLLAVVGAILLIVILFFGFRSVRDINGSIGDNKNYVIEIPEGAGTNSIANLLRNRGIIESPNTFKLYAKLTGEKKYQAGRYTLNPSLPYKELFQKLQAAPDQGGENDVKIVVPEGYEARQVADLLVEKGVIADKDVFLKELDEGRFDFPFITEIKRKENRLEGYLYPATYLIEKGTAPHDIIQTMLEKFNAVVVQLYNESGSDSTLDEIVTLASVIEREAASDEERGKIASVFNNRLYEGMKLESCATVQYILQERKTILSTKDTAIDSKYNTYKYKGLPVGPIASPGEASVKAALNPEKTDYMYFVAAADGSQNFFSKTYDEHMEKVKEVQGSSGD